MPGEFLNVAFHKYLADLGRFSGSFLDKLARDPSEAGDMLHGKPESPPTDEMRLGKYGHALGLEGPAAARDRFALPPTRHQAYRALTAAKQKLYDAYEAMTVGERGLVDIWREDPPAKPNAEQKAMLKLVGKAPIVKVLQDPSPAGEYRTMERKGAENLRLWDEFVESAKGRTIIRHEQIPIGTAMVKALHQHPQAAKLLAKGRPEVSMHWDCPHTGQPMKGRLDWLTDEDEPVELKFTHLVAPDNINRWLGSGWGRKSGIYLDAVKTITSKPRKMWWIFVEMPKVPWNGRRLKVHTCWVNEEHVFVKAGRDGVPGRYRGYIDLVEWGQHCRRTDDWRHPWEHVQDGSMVVPDWLASTVENTEKLAYGKRPALTGGRQVA